MGEVAQAILQGDSGMESLLHLEDELVQVAAVTVAWLENLERYKRINEAWNDTAANT